MSEVKINKKGQIVIPKYIRDKYGLAPGITLFIEDFDYYIGVRPISKCPRCGKALPDELRDRGACEGCPLPEKIIIY